MSTDSTATLRQRMIEDMAARKLGPHSQRSHIYSCRRFAAFLGRSPEEATADDVRRFQRHLVEAGLSIPNRNRILTFHFDSLRRQVTARLSPETALHFDHGFPVVHMSSLLWAGIGGAAKLN